MRTKSWTRVGTHRGGGIGGQPIYRVIKIGIFEAILPVFAVMLVTFFRFFYCQYFGNFSGSPRFDKKTFGLPVAGQVPKRK